MNAKCGLTFKANEPEDLAKKVFEIYKNPKLAGEMGKNGQIALKKDYNWQKASHRLLELYKKLELNKSK